MSNHVRNGREAKVMRQKGAVERKTKRVKMSTTQLRDALVAMGHGHSREVRRLNQRIKDEAVQSHKRTDNKDEGKGDDRQADS